MPIVILLIVHNIAILLAMTNRNIFMNPLIGKIGVVLIILMLEWIMIFDKNEILFVLKHLFELYINILII